MTKISAKIIADSTNKFGNRITTFVLTYPRIIHAEVMTHRMFSRNAASSRAVPFEKLCAAVEKDPFIPVAWQRDHSGMQGTEYVLDGDEVKTLEQSWLDGRDEAIFHAKSLSGQGVTKQICNRLLETYQWYTVILTATEFENFFSLRCPQYELFYEQIPMQFRSRKDLLEFVKQVESEEFKNSYDNLTDLEWRYTNKGMAEIHLMDLAECMWDSYKENQPKELEEGEWHIPFGGNMENVSKFAMDNYPNNFEHGDASLLQQIRVKIATARCARVSYTVVGEEGKPDNYENDIKLHDRLFKAGHYSPFEHCAKSRRGDIWSGNFRGFIQYRQMLEGKI